MSLSIGRRHTRSRRRRCRRSRMMLRVRRRMTSGEPSHPPGRSCRLVPANGRSGCDADITEDDNSEGLASEGVEGVASVGHDGAERLRNHMSQYVPSLGQGECSGRRVPRESG